MSKRWQIFRRPTTLAFEGNVAENWRRFEEDFDIFFKAAHAGKSDAEHAYTLLNIGPEAIIKSRGFTYEPAVVGQDGEVITPESKEDPNVLKQTFRELCTHHRNVIIERHKFRFQKPGESFSSFSLLALVRSHNTANMVTRMMSLSEADLYVAYPVRSMVNLTLPKAIQIGQIQEQSETDPHTL